MVTYLPARCLIILTSTITLTSILPTSSSTQHPVSDVRATVASGATSALHKECDLWIGDLYSHTCEFDMVFTVTSCRTLGVLPPVERVPHPDTTDSLLS